MASYDPFVVAFLALILLLIFFFYLMFRRTVTGFREGKEQGQGKDR